MDCSLPRSSVRGFSSKYFNKQVRTRSTYLLRVSVQTVSSRLPRFRGFPHVSARKEPAWQYRRLKRYNSFDPWVRKTTPPEEEMAAHCSIPVWRMPWTEKPGGATVCGVTKESDTTERAQAQWQPCFECSSLISRWFSLFCHSMFVPKRPIHEFVEHLGIFEIEVKKKVSI